jgi:hypothetical protein
MINKITKYVSFFPHSNPEYALVSDELVHAVNSVRMCITPFV